MPGTFSPSPRVSNPDKHHGTCVTHVPWCMPGSLTSRFLWSRRRGKTFPAFPAHAQTAILRICQEAHVENHMTVFPLATCQQTLLATNYLLIDNTHEIKNNAWVTVNNSFWVTSDPKIVIHVNECIILFLTRYLVSGTHNSAKTIIDCWFRHCR